MSYKKVSTLNEAFSLKKKLMQKGYFARIYDNGNNFTVWFVKLK